MISGGGITREEMETQRRSFRRKQWVAKYILAPIALVITCGSAFLHFVGYVPN